MIGRLVLGKISDDAVGIEAIANFKLNLQDPSKNTFRAKIRDLSFEKLASAFGTKQPLLRFQSQARFLDEAIVTFEQSDKESMYPLICAKYLSRTLLSLKALCQLF